MYRVNLSIDEEFLKKLLNTYSDMTGLSVIFYTSGKKFIFSEKNLPVFCQEFVKIVGSDACVMDYPTNEIKKLYQCPTGLWCYLQPLEVDGTVVGTFFIGHRRITGRKKESKKVLKQTLSEHNVDADNSAKLMKLMEKVDTVRENAFDIALFKKLSFIEQFAIMEHLRAIAFEKEAVGLAHELLLPMQSIIADAENLFNESEKTSELKDIAEDVLQQVTKLYFIAENIRGSVIKERDKFGYEFHDVEIYPIIQDTIKLFRKEAKRKGVEINNPVVKKSIPVSVMGVKKVLPKGAYLPSELQEEIYETLGCKSG